MPTNVSLSDTLVFDDHVYYAGSPHIDHDKQLLDFLFFTDTCKRFVPLVFTDTLFLFDSIKTNTHRLNDILTFTDAFPYYFSNPWRVG